MSSDETTATPAPLRVVLADDEDIARTLLRAYIGALNKGGDAIEIVGMCANGREAADTVCRERPDILFLDMSMPDLDGVGVVAELVEKMPEHLPQVVFVTGFDAGMMGTIDASALHFLKKPLSRDRFAQAVAKAREAIAQRAPGELSTKLRAWLAGRAGAAG